MPRGRTRDEDAHERILAATQELIGTKGAGTVTINAIAAAAGVAKQTIYRWWPSKTAVVLDALVEGTLQATPFPTTDDPRADFERHLRAVITLFRSPTGSIIRELLAEAQSDPAIAAEFVERFWAPRRELSLARLASAIDAGQVRADIDIELTLDAIYGPLWTRLMIGHLPMKSGHAKAIVDATWSGIIP